MKELDLERLGADVGYTLDAELEGEIQFETFSADRAVVHVTGLAIHPCCAKDKLVNALYLLASLVAGQTVPPSPPPQAHVDTGACALVAALAFVPVGLLLISLL